jgi:hypothetical protein
MFSKVIFLLAVYVLMGIVSNAQKISPLPGTFQLLKSIKLAG